MPLSPTRLLDTTVLSNFAFVQRPDLLLRALGDAATTPTVLAELHEGERLGRVPNCDWHWLQVLRPTADELRLALQLASQLDPGEAECIVVAESRRCIFLSDDRIARRLAQQLGVPISGTLGILLTLVRNGHLRIEEADGLLAKMIFHGYRSPVESLAELLP